MSGREVHLAIYVEHGKQARAAWAMDSLKRSMRWDEQRFGREYDLDVFNIVAVSDFNMGAMENKGLNIFNDRLILASPETATDTIFEAIESVVAHEYFHNWTGNRITCRDWFQLCLKEGLTVYRDQEFSADERSATVQRIIDVRALKTHQFAEDAGPLAHPVRPESYIEINNFYTSTVYEKGAEVVRMIATILGRDDFRKGMDLYFDRHDGEAATVEEFVRCFEDASGVDLAQFRLWYSQAGTPEIVAKLRYDKDKKSAQLDVEQILPPTPGQSTKKPMHIPIRLGLLGGNGHDIALKLDSGEAPADGVVSLTKRRQSFRFVDVPSRPVPSLLRGFSAPVNVTLDLPDDDAELLMASDSDLFNRWQAANSYAARTLVEAVAHLVSGKKSNRPLRYARALGAALQGDDLEPAYRAELLKLPTQADVARIIGKNVDPALVHRAHRGLMKLIGKTLGRQLEDLYAEMDASGPFSPDAQSAGRRALRNAALTLLTARGNPADIARLAKHYATATNMTDRAHALFQLAYRGGAEAKQALADFYESWQADNVVIDTWFAAQAQSPLAGTLARVKALTRHPLFQLTAPNKVRALVGTFAVDQSRAVQSTGRRRLRLPRRSGAGARPHQPADRRPHARRHALLARARKRPARQSPQGLATRCTYQTAVAGRAGNRLPRARRVTSNNLWRRRAYSVSTADSRWCELIFVIRGSGFAGIRKSLKNISGEMDGVDNVRRRTRAADHCGNHLRSA